MILNQKEPESTILYIEKRTLLIMDYLDFRILSTAFCRYIFLHVILMDCCFSSLIRLSKYFSSQFISQRGRNFSGIFWIMENSISSALLWNLWKNSFTRLRSLSSISIINHSNLFICLYLYNTFQTENIQYLL